MGGLAAIINTLKTLKPALAIEFHVKSIGIFGSAVSACI